MRRLSRRTTPDGAMIGASAGAATGIVHLGLGNFHRAHAAVYTANALAAEPGDWGIYELNHYVLGRLAWNPTTSRNFRNSWCLLQRYVSPLYVTSLPACR